MNDFFKRKDVSISFITLAVLILLIETIRFILGKIAILDIAPFGGGLILLLGMYVYLLKHD